MKPLSGWSVSRLLPVLLLVFGASAAQPQTPSLYTVEIVVFRNSGTVGALPNTNTPPAVTDDGVDVTKVGASQLNTATSRLRKAGFEILAHVAWTQSPTPWPRSPIAWNSGLGVATTQLGIGNAVTGKIFLERGDYLDLGVDLWVENATQRYRITQVRNVKVGEIHYFDHPAVGVLAIVTRGGG